MMEKPEYTAQHEHVFILLYLHQHTITLLKLLIVYHRLLKTWSSDNAIQEFSLA